MGNFNNDLKLIGIEANIKGIMTSVKAIEATTAGIMTSVKAIEATTAGIMTSVNSKLATADLKAVVEEASSYSAFRTAVQNL